MEITSSVNNTVLRGLFDRRSEIKDENDMAALMNEVAEEGIMLSSDGLINSFRCEEDFLKFGRRVINSVRDGSEQFLGEHLKNRSRLGSRDDISVAALSVEY